MRRMCKTVINGYSQEVPCRIACLRSWTKREGSVGTSADCPRITATRHPPLGEHMFMCCSDIKQA